MRTPAKAQRQLATRITFVLGAANALRREATVTEIASEAHSLGDAAAAFEHRARDLAAQLEPSYRKKLIADIRELCGDRVARVIE